MKTSSPSIEKVLKNILSSWFLSEPLLFGTATTHHLVANKNMTVPMRTGKLRIEYNPEVLAECNEGQIENYFKIEVYRILLGHPYSRQPYKAQSGIVLMASDITLYQVFNDEKIRNTELGGILYLKNQAMRFATLKNPLPEKWQDSEELRFFQRNLHLDGRTGNLMLVDKLSFEQWYRRLYFLVHETSGKGENAGSGIGDLSQDFGEASELWEEDENALAQIRSQIQKAEVDEGWGGLGGNEIRSLKEECDFSFDYRRALTHFRQSIVSANRKLTRMRPSRRYGFKAMGSRYERKANVLIAVDVSGSITDESFAHFSHAIKNFFFLGIIENIDLIFFDVNLKNTKAISFKKKISLEEIKGRGGTSFQPAIDFFEEHKAEYSGMIIFTDGEGAIPSVCGSPNVLWILDSRLAYEKSRQWIATISGAKSTYLPF